jgi:hypothetical protein
MEDNNAINEQLNAVNYEEEYNKLVAEFNKLRQTAQQLFNRVKQLENNWMLQRAEFLFKVVADNKFNVDIRQKAQEELENFLFPSKQEESVEENNKEV